MTGPTIALAPTEGITMPEGAQQGQNQGQAQARAKQQGKISPIIAGFGAALVAAAVTVTLMMGNTSRTPTVTVTQPLVPTSAECQLPDRTVLFSITEGKTLISSRRVESATVVIRAGDYVSGPIVLTHEPQAVALPVPLPGVEQDITVEGTTQDVVMTMQGYPGVSNSTLGYARFSRKLAPLKPC
jgi:hypothetical protein